MKVILLRDISKIGKKYEIKEVASGYARNFLIPKGDALYATPREVLRIEKMRTLEGTKSEKDNFLFKSNLETLEGKKVSYTAKASEKGGLFAGINKKDVTEILKEKLGISVPDEAVQLPSVIKETGEYSIVVGDDNKKATFVLTIEGEK